MKIWVYLDKILNDLIQYNMLLSKRVTPFWSIKRFIKNGYPSDYHIIVWMNGDNISLIANILVMKSEEI